MKTASLCSCISTNPAKHITKPGADVNSTARCGAALLISAADGGIRGVKLLLIAGADLQAATLSPAPPQATAEDALDTGKQALHRGDYIAAQEFFRAYLKDHPENVEALLLAGNAAFELKQYEDAFQSFLTAISNLAWKLSAEYSEMNKTAARLVIPLAAPPWDPHSWLAMRVSPSRQEPR